MSHFPVARSFFSYEINIYILIFKQMERSYHHVEHSHHFWKMKGEISYHIYLLISFHWYISEQTNEWSCSVSHRVQNKRWSKIIDGELGEKKKEFQWPLFSQLTDINQINGRVVNIFEASCVSDEKMLSFPSNSLNLTIILRNTWWTETKALYNDYSLAKSNWRRPSILNIVQETENVTWIIICNIRFSTSSIT